MSDDFEIGFGKPPRHTRFKPGQSGNPNGRPKGAKNLETDLQEELSEPMQVPEGGRERRLTKQRALIKTLVTRALKGNDRAAAKVLDLYLRILRSDGLDDAADEPLVELETDKVTVEVPAPSAGTLESIFAKDGETVGVGAVLGSIGDGESVPSGNGKESKPAKPAKDGPGDGAGDLVDIVVPSAGESVT